jgi:hypothetical protein
MILAANNGERDGDCSSVLIISLRLYLARFYFVARGGWDCKRIVVSSLIGCCVVVISHSNRTCFPRFVHSY